jgi:hypothetical protein
MAPYRCPICGKLGATCGPVTRNVQPVDATLTGVIVAGNKVMPKIPPPPSDMTDEERDEYQMMWVAQHKRSLRSQLLERQQTMADGKAPYTMLSYVKCTDGITRKMRPDVAKQYVDMNDGAEIVREGALPMTKEGEVLGATKARTGEVFNEDGTQKEEVQLVTSSTMFETDRTNPQAVSPAVGGTGASESAPSAPAPSAAPDATAKPVATKPVRE